MSDKPLNVPLLYTIYGHLLILTTDALDSGKSNEHNTSKRIIKLRTC